MYMYWKKNTLKLSVLKKNHPIKHKNEHREQITNSNYICITSYIMYIKEEYVLYVIYLKLDQINLFE